MLRTSCLAWSPACARMWTSLTSPSGVVTTRALRMPSRLVSRFSAFRTPQGSGAPSDEAGERVEVGAEVEVEVEVGCRGLNPVTVYVLRVPRVVSR